MFAGRVRRHPDRKGRSAPSSYPLGKLQRLHLRVAHRDRAAVQREVWQPWTVGDVSAEDYSLLVLQPAYSPELDLVAVTGDGIIASYASCWLDQVNSIGDFGPVGTLKQYRRLGLSRAVLLEGLRRWRAAGMDRTCVSTGAGNLPARNLYEAAGFRVVNGYLDYVQAETS